MSQGGRHAVRVNEDTPIFGLSEAIHRMGYPILIAYIDTLADLEEATAPEEGLRVMLRKGTVAKHPAIHIFMDEDGDPSAAVTSSGDSI